MGLFPRSTDTHELGLPVGPKSNVYYVDPANGNDSFSGTTPKKPLETLPAAYAKCTANQHDVVAYIAGSSGISLTETLTWAKNYTHLVGLCAPTFVGQRARIFAHADNDDVTPLVNVTATGCIMKDLYIFNGPNDAGCLINVQVTGGRNYFENIHFAGGGHATNAITGGASLKLDGAAECMFRNCTIGLDTIAAATGMAGVIVDSDAKRIAFEDCRFTMYAGHAGAKFVHIADSSAFDRYIDFKDCLFLNDAVNFTMTEAFTVPAGMGSATHRITLRNCGFVGATNIEGNNRGIVYADMVAPTDGAFQGILRVSNTT